MIKELQLENFLFIKKTNLQFSQSLNVITGETGAGKSVLLEAVKLILGKKARSGIVLAGENSASIHAEFDISRLNALKDNLVDRGLGNEDDPNLLLVSRTFKEEGGGRVFVNGIMTTAASLKEIGPYLMEIHGQNEHQTLLNPDTQRQMLDRMGSEAHKDNISQLKRVNTRRKALLQELAELESINQRATEKIEELELCIQDLAKLGLHNEAEEDELKEELKKLAHSEQILTSLQGAAANLLDSQEELGAVTRVYKAQDFLRRVSDYDEELGSLAERLEGLYYELKAIGTDLEYKAEETNLNPDRLYEVQTRLSEISRLCRKYSCSFKELFELNAKANEELEQLMQPDLAKNRVRKELAETNKEFESLLEKITSERGVLAKSLNSQVSAEMESLGFNAANFEARLLPIEPGAHGAEDIEFFVALNPGAPGGSLRKIASGGELSRVALSIKKVLATTDALPTLIFDEIDAGIGGKTAEAVAESLRKLGSEKQVLLVTHLHQIAKEGHKHYRVAKTVENDATKVEIKHVSGEERVEEIARMLGQTDAAGLDFAKTLLAQG